MWQYDDVAMWQLADGTTVYEPIYVTVITYSAHNLANPPCEASENRRACTPPF
jgi:hypothetical protein